MVAQLSATGGWPGSSTFYESRLWFGRVQKLPPHWDRAMAQAYFQCRGDGRMYKMIKTDAGEVAIVCTCMHCDGDGCSTLGNS